MTKKEAKEIMCKVTFYWELGEQTLTQNQINEALDMAIKALEQQPDVKTIYDIAFTDGVKAYKNMIELVEEEKKEPCEDCISRKEMLKYQEYLHGKMSNEENHKLWEFIKQLPSVTPKASSALDKIRAEIDGLTYYWCEVHPRSVIDDVLDIIDKYKAESEDKE